MRWIRSLKHAFSWFSSALLVLPVAIVDAFVYRSHEILQTVTTGRCDDIQTWDAYELALGFVYEVVVHLLERDACIAKSCVEIQVLDKPDVQILQTRFEYAQRSHVSVSGLAFSP